MEHLDQQEGLIALIYSLWSTDKFFSEYQYSDDSDYVNYCADLNKNIKVRNLHFEKNKDFMSLI